MFITWCLFMIGFSMMCASLACTSVNAIFGLVFGGLFLMFVGAGVQDPFELVE